MPLKLGTTTIGDIYKGTTKIDSIYKGTTLVYSSGTWEQWYQEFIYNALIPTTINSKQVKNKARIDTVYGNSVVENQLVQNGNFESNSGWTPTYGTISVSNNVLTYVVSTVGNESQNRISRPQELSIVANHKYLVITKIKPLDRNYGIYITLYSSALSTTLMNGKIGSATYNQNNIISNIFTANGSGTTDFRLTFGSSEKTIGDRIEVYDVMLIDLTKMFPFDTPTTLTDNRVQAILNKGYIPYNTGEIKSVDIGEISSVRIPDIYQEVEYIESTGTQYIDSGIINNTNSKYILDIKFNSSVSRCLVGYGTTAGTYFEKNVNDLYALGGGVDTNVSAISRHLVEFKMLSGTTYLTVDNATISRTTGNVFDNFKLFSIYVSEYEGAGNVLYGSKIYVNDNLVRNFVPCYRKSDNEIGLYDTVNQVFYTNQGTGTFLKGNDVHTNEHTITFKYQGSGVGTAHDTMEITNAEYVFTRNMSRYTFSGSESWAGQSYQRYYTDVLSSVIKAPSSSTKNANCLMAELMISNQSNLSDVDNAFDIDTNGNFKIRSTSNATSTATAQSFMSGKSVYYQLATPQVIRIPKKHLGVYTLDTNKAIGDTITLSDIKNTMNGYSIVDILSNLGTLNGTTITLTKALPSGTIIFYETQDEVADITNIIGIQAGGTITTNSNVLPNIDFGVKCK